MRDGILLNIIFTNPVGMAIILAAHRQGAEGRRTEMTTKMTMMERVEGLSQTRRDILQLLKERGEATATALSKAMGISRVAVHHHLDWLKEMHWVSARVERKGRGRPAEVFFLTEQAQEKFFPRRYDVLATVMLNEVAAELGEEHVQKLFRRYRQWLLEGFENRKASLSEKVKALADFLAKEGYLARWEETGDGFLVTLLNCPIAQVAKRFQEACSSELEMLEEILEAPVTRRCHQVAGDFCCSYFVAKPKRNSRGERQFARRNSARRSHADERGVGNPQP